MVKCLVVQQRCVFCLPLLSFFFFFALAFVFAFAFAFTLALALAFACVSAGLGEFSLGLCTTQDLDLCCCCILFVCLCGCCFFLFLELLQYFFWGGFRSFSIFFVHVCVIQSRMTLYSMRRNTVCVCVCVTVPPQPSSSLAHTTNTTYRRNDVPPSITLRRHPNAAMQPIVVNNLCVRACMHACTT